MKNLEYDVGYIIIMVATFSVLIILFLLNYFNLTAFKNCYDNDFKYDYCRRYKNY